MLVFDKVSSFESGLWNVEALLLGRGCFRLTTFRSMYDSYFIIMVIALGPYRSIGHLKEHTR